MVYFVEINQKTSKNIRNQLSQMVELFLNEGCCSSSKMFSLASHSSGVVLPDPILIPAHSA